MQNMLISLSKMQYEQLIESLRYATNLNFQTEMTASEKLYNVETSQIDYKQNISPFKSSVKFLVPLLTLSLKNEHFVSLINLTFSEFSFLREVKTEEIEVRILLESILMEDLKCSANSKFRNLIDSSCDTDDLKMNLKTKLASSCPDLLNTKYAAANVQYGSSPSDLHKVYREQNNCVNKSMISFEIEESIKSNNEQPTKKLVVYKSLTKICNNELPTATKSSIDFNSLLLIISLEKWYIVLDFFGLTSYNPEGNGDLQTQSKENGK